MSYEPVACAVGPSVIVLLDYVTVPSVKRTLTIEPNFEKTVLILKLISGDNYSKFNISHTLGLKIMKASLENPTH